MNLRQISFVLACETLIFAGCAMVERDPNLVFHCTFDDREAILSPEVGLSGTAKDATFVAGKVGKALYVPAHATVAEFPFPNGLPTACGTIDFWAKLEGGKDHFNAGGDPYLFAIVDAENRSILFEMHFNANNGCGKSGLIFGLPGGDGDASSVGGNSYSRILGKNALDWHHYEIRWNTASNQSTISLRIDGNSSCNVVKSRSWTERFVKSMKRPVKLVISNPIAGSGIGKSPFALDEFRVLKAVSQK